MFAAGLGWQVNNNDMRSLKGWPFAVHIFFMSKGINNKSVMVTAPPVEIQSLNPEPHGRVFIRLPPAGTSRDRGQGHTGEFRTGRP
jgi:hypothetical protein